MPKYKRPKDPAVKLEMREWVEQVFMPLKMASCYIAIIPMPGMVSSTGTTTWRSR